MNKIARDILELGFLYLSRCYRVSKNREFILLTFNGNSYKFL